MASVKIFKASLENKTFQFPNPFESFLFLNLSQRRSSLLETPTPKVFESINVCEENGGRTGTRGIPNSYEGNGGRFTDASEEERWTETALLVSQHPSAGPR